MKLKKYTIIGSGISGINAALTLLKKGHAVDILDYDNEDNDPINTKETFQSIKESENIDSLKFFYGEDLINLHKNNPDELFTFPERRRGLTKKNIFRYDQDVNLFEPKHGYCKGGLGSFWGANSVEFNQDDLIGFGIDKNEFVSAYSELGDRFKLSGGINDDISEIANNSYKIKYDRNLSNAELKLLKMYQEKFQNNKVNDFRMGQSRLAINSSPATNDSCYNSGLCMWRCPNSSIYDPKQTLAECQSYNSFNYKKGFTVIFLESCNLKKTNIKNIIYTDSNGIFKKEGVENVILAAGALNSSIIHLRSLFENGLSTSNKVRSYGLMDTQVVKIPYFNPYAINDNFNTSKIQLNNLTAFIRNYSNDFPNWIQAELLSLGSLIYHPIINKVGLGILNSLFTFNTIKSNLGVASLFIPDRLDSSNYIEIDFSKKVPELNFKYQQLNDVQKVKKDSISAFIGYMRRLGILISKHSAIHLKHGEGIHYAGTIPIMENKTLGCVDRDCKSYDFDNLHVVDGSVFPSLPSKSISLNLAANAIRVARKL